MLAVLFFLFSGCCWRSCCCGGHALAVIFAVACCMRHCCCLSTAFACIPAVAGIVVSIAGVPLLPDVLTVAGLPAYAESLVLLVLMLFLSSLLLLAFLLLLTYLLLLSSLLLLAFVLSWRSYFSWCLYILYCTVRNIRPSDHGCRTVIFFCYRTLEYRIWGWRVLETIGSKPRYIGLTKTYWLPSSVASKVIT